MNSKKATKRYTPSEPAQKKKKVSAKEALKIFKGEKEEVMEDIEDTPEQKKMVVKLEWEVLRKLVETKENRKKAEEVQKALLDVVHQVNDLFAREDHLPPPLFLWNVFGAYVVKSTYAVEWTESMDTLWVNDNKEPSVLWRISNAQRKLRFAMLKEFQTRANEVIREMGYFGCELLFSSDILWPMKNRLE